MTADRPPDSTKAGRDWQAVAYGEAVSTDARVRQQQLAETRHVCCGEWKDGPHHPQCRNWVEPTEVVVHPDQQGLL